MKYLACLLTVAITASALWAGETRAGPAKLKPPKGVTLTPEQQKMLDDANGIVERGYVLLMDKHEPAAAVDELRKALVIMNQLAILKGDAPQLAGVAEGNEKGTPEDKIKTAGNIEKIVEIGAAMGAAAPDDVDDGLHKRKIVEDAKEAVKKIDAEQKQVTLELQSAAGAAGGEEQKPQQQQQQQAQQAQAAQQPQADAQAAQQNQAQQQADAQAAQQNQGQQQADAQAAQQQPAKGQDLASKEDAIARELNKLATKVAEAGKTSQAQQAFHKAATEASKTAEMIRKGETQNAAAASKQTERAIQDALREAGLASEGALAAAVSAIEQQVAKLQATQQDIQNKAQQAGKSADGAPAPERVKQERATALAVEQGKLKPQVEGIQQALEDLSRPAGGDTSPARTTENAARAELASAAVEMQKNRPKQGVVNAAMRLAQGETAAATKAMSQVQTALDAAAQRVAAAEAALASGDASRLESAHRAVQQLAASARRLEQTALNAAGKPAEQTAGKPGENQQADAGKPEAKAAAQGQDTKTGKPGEQKKDGQPEAKTADAKTQDAAGGEVSASWGQVLNKSAEQLGGETARTAKRIGNIAPEVSQQLSVAGTGVKTEFERKFPESLGQVHKLLTALEKAEQELGAKVAKEKEGKALRNYRKEDIPRAYREAVASYYEELAKEEKK